MVSDNTKLMESQDLVNLYIDSQPPPPVTDRPISLFSPFTATSKYKTIAIF
jgi:hypothetical protein